MAKKKDTDPSLRKDELQKQLKKKNSSLEKLKRELKIEAALEKVRARTMAMRSSDELLDTSQLFFQQIRELGETVVQASIAIVNEEAGSVELSSSIHGNHLPLTLNVPIDDPYVMTKGVAAWKAKQKSLTLVFKGQELKNYNERRNSFLETKINFPEDQWVVNLSFFSKGWLSFSSNKNVTGETTVMMKRFAAVIEQTYTRFLDLQKAEAHAREAQIEAALERVRFHTMAMNNSDDVGIATIAMFSELEKLELKNIRVGIAIFRHDQTAEVWSFMKTEEGKTVRTSGTLDMNATLVWQQFYKGWQQKQDLFHYFLAGEEKKAYYKVLSNSPNYSLSEKMPELPDQHFQSYYFSEGAIWTYSLNLHSEEHKQILKKFTAVFSLTFRRYQDLKKAEAQAREAQIEAALEKVRSRSLAVHQSDEFKDVVKVFFEKLEELGLEANAIGINTFIENSNDVEVYICGRGEAGLHIIHYRLPYFDSDISNDILEARKNNTEFFTKKYNKEEKDIFYENALQVSDLKNIPEDIKRMIFDSIDYFISLAVTKHSMIVVNDFAGNVLSENNVDIIKRFARVFEQAHVRFLDLKKAEAQAREAQIEAALERVRSKAMSMQKSEDLSNAVAIVFDELEKMDLGAIRCGISIINKEDHTTKIWSTTKTAEGTAVQVSGDESMNIHPLLKGAFNAWSQLKDFSYILKDDDLINFYTALSNTNFKLPDDQNDSSKSEQHMYVAHFPVGGLYVFKESEFSEDLKKIIKRFGEVFNLTYTRYNDLQIAEASTREAIRQAALDRIRADIASMRTTKDLERITPLIWSELTVLGIPFIRCGVFIMNDEQQLIHTFLSTPDGKAIAAFHIPYDTPGNIKQVISHWNDHKNYIDHWDEDAFTPFAETLVKQGALTSPEQYLQTIPHGGFYLHFLPFLQGMLYVGNTTQLSEEETDLIQSIADAFSTAYARYEDFNKLESAKQQIEKTLVDLKLAQSQLVQSEKMASLGELTAGIAHEIQNPLNFVNNFSEVSNELIDEMKEELSKGNYEDVNAIANDVKQNLEKINHHGKRADAIVKGMLQHSRSSTSQKESTDINALADEYLRLSYHGLRAKDNSFNAIIKTDFDNSIGKINIIPQDIGRVLLNLYNNAFYAVKPPTPKGELEKPQIKYEPTVTVTTRSIQPPLGGRTVEIKVIDNGGGIPQKVVDKIFQPFFTTKPTGQGTGLGLSLSYDIIKAHGGEIKVETKEGDGSSFIIQLPVV